ncbi:MAG: Na+/H+ antiporter subunit E [Caenispirillum bisanense]|nr:Na+/H+ antiporter subunit E [Caenispirillum bisanense]MCA1974861.1 Na+/H+ antiporter subunit E [Caenispirillum sp.]
MILFMLNLCLAVGWGFLWSDFSLVNLAAGFVAGYLALLASRPLYGGGRYFGAVWRALALAGYFLFDLARSSVRVAWDVLTPRHLSRPGIVGVPLDARSDGEILMTANLISLTPGTLSLDVSADRRTLWVHAMFIDDPDALRRDLKDGMERRVLEAMR